MDEPQGRNASMDEMLAKQAHVAMGRISGPGEPIRAMREPTGRELILKLAVELEQQANSMRRLADALPNEIHWQADQALRLILKPHTQG
jgi:hypothetical protein